MGDGEGQGVGGGGALTVGVVGFKGVGWWWGVRVSSGGIRGRGSGDGWGGCLGVLGHGVRFLSSIR